MGTNDLTGQIIGAAIEVHKVVGPGLLESAYEECLCHELSNRGLSFERQQKLPITYKAVHLDCGYRLDFFVADQVIVEVKAVENILPIHEAQVLTYLKMSGRQVGLLINFNVPVLKDGLRRFIVGFD